MKNNFLKRYFQDYKNLVQQLDYKKIQNFCFKISKLKKKK